MPAMHTSVVDELVFALKLAQAWIEEARDMPYAPRSDATMHAIREAIRKATTP